MSHVTERRSILGLQKQCVQAMNRLPVEKGRATGHDGVWEVAGDDKAISSLALYTGERPDVLRNLRWHGELKPVGRSSFEYIVFEHVAGDATKTSTRGRGKLGLDQLCKAKVLFLPLALAEQIRRYLKKARGVCEGVARTGSKERGGRRTEPNGAGGVMDRERHQARPWMAYDPSGRSAGNRLAGDLDNGPVYLFPGLAAPSPPGRRWRLATGHRQQGGKGRFRGCRRRCLRGGTINTFPLATVFSVVPWLLRPRREA